MLAELKPYPQMKDSGVEWLGKVPAHWKIERAKWLFSKQDRPVREIDEVVTCFRDGVVTLRRNRRLSGFTESLKEIGYQGIRRGDLVIHAMDAFAGAIGVADSDGKSTPMYAVCKPRALANSQFYAHTVREMARSQWILALAKGVRERSTDFRFADFAVQLVPQPPLTEQGAIARFLDFAVERIDRYVRGREKLIALLEEQKQAIIHQAVTGQIDVRTGKPYPKYSDSGVEWLGRTPSHWTVSPLKRWVCTKITDGPHETPNFKSEGIPFMSAESMVDGHLDFSRLRGYISRQQHEIYSAKCRPQRDDIFVCKSGATTGKIAIVETDIEFSVWSPLALVRVDSREVLARLLFFVLQTDYVQRQVRETWSYGTQPNLSMGAMERIMVALPPVDEQHVILEHLVQETGASIDSAVDQARRSIGLFREYRTRLIADVVTGKLDVREAAASLEHESPMTEGGGSLD